MITYIAIITAAIAIVKNDAKSGCSYEIELPKTVALVCDIQ